MGQDRGEVCNCKLDEIRTQATSESSSQSPWGGGKVPLQPLCSDGPEQQSSSPQ